MQTYGVWHQPALAAQHKRYLFGKIKISFLEQIKQDVRLGRSKVALRNQVICSRLNCKTAGSDALLPRNLSKWKRAPASETCFLILSALAKLTTGPRLVPGRVGSPSLYVYNRQLANGHKFITRRADLCDLDKLSHKLVVHRFVNVDPLNTKLSTLLMTLRR